MPESKSSLQLNESSADADDIHYPLLIRVSLSNLKDGEAQQK
jgi:hypothetical protein